MFKCDGAVAPSMGRNAILTDEERTALTNGIMVEDEVIEDIEQRLSEELAHDLEALEQFDPALVDIVLGVIDEHLERRYQDIEA